MKKGGIGVERREKKFRRDGMMFCHFVSEREEIGLPRADALYEQFCLHAEQYAENTVARDAIEKFDADENPKKRFRFSAPVCACHVRVRDGEGFCFVEGSCTVRGACVCRFSHVWDKGNSLLVPPRFWRKKRGALQDLECTRGGKE